MTPPFQTVSTIMFLCDSYASDPITPEQVPVWALPVSLAATHGIDFSFSSSWYLDVSVPKVDCVTL